MFSPRCALESTILGSFLGFIILLGSSCSDPTAAGGLRDLPVMFSANYAFDEVSGATIINSAGDYYHGSVSGASRVPGQVGNALYFGTGAFAVTDESDDLPYRTRVDFENDTLSIAAWVNMGAATPGTLYHIIGNADSGLGSFRLQVNGGQIELLVYNNNAFRRVILGSQTLTANTWHHIAVTYNGTSAITYLDGEQDATANISHAIDPNVNRIYIGSKYGTNSFMGTIDELQVIERVLSPAEIHDYYISTN